MTSIDLSSDLYEETILDQMLTRYIASLSLSDEDMDFAGKYQSLGIFRGILQEVWQTLLPRQLVFQTLAKDLLVLDVADRQIFSLAKASGPWTLGMEDNIKKFLDPRSTGVTLAEIHSLLTHFGKVTDQVAFARQKGAKPHFGTKGISAKSLHNFRPDLASGQPGLAKLFLTNLGDIPRSVLVTEGLDRLEMRGDIAPLEHLRKAITLEDETGALIEDQLIILSMTADSSKTNQPDAVLIAHTKQTQILCGLDARDVCKAAGLWIAAKDQTG